MASMVRQFLCYLFTGHEETIIRTNRERMFVECLNCGKCSLGVTMGGHAYGAAK
jgi:hypothetical protein